MPGEFEDLPEPTVERETIPLQAYQVRQGDWVTFNDMLLKVVRIQDELYSSTLVCLDHANRPYEIKVNASTPLRVSREKK